MALNSDSKQVIEAHLHVAKVERDSAASRVELYEKMLKEGFNEPEEETKEEVRMRMARKVYIVISKYRQFNLDHLTNY